MSPSTCPTQSLAFRVGRTRPGLGRAAALVATLALAAGTTGWAQTVYRIVGPDGRVTFSDKPPAQGEGRPQNLGRTPAPAAVPLLPLELRQTAARFPVILHTGNNCAPCAAGRSLLNSRGIPFTEKTVTTPEDSQALERLSGEAVLPLLLIGAQQLKGFSLAEWAQYLNAAGYPASSRLPAGFQQAAARPLVEIPKANNPVNAASAASSPESAASSAGASNLIPSAPRTEPGSNPAGIQF